jgi:hypothetical protein
VKDSRLTSAAASRDYGHPLTNINLDLFSIRQSKK